MGRPSVSPLLWVAAAAWVGSVTGTEVAQASWVRSDAAPLLWAAAGLALLLGLAARIRRPVVTWAAYALVLCALLAAGRGVALARTAASLEASAPQEWYGVVTEDPRDGSFGVSVTVRLEAAAGADLVRISWPDGVPQPRYGEQLALSTRLRCADRLAANAADLFRRAELLRATPWKVRSLGMQAGLLGALAGWRNASVDRLRRLGGRGAETLASMLFAAPAGGDGALAVQDARTAGVAWLVTASGIHLAVIVLIAERLAGLAHLQRRGRAVVCAAVIAAVSFAAGLRISLLRAAIVGCVGLLGRFQGRRRDATSGLAAAVLVLLAMDTAAAYDVGLLLAVCAVLSIALFAPLANSWLTPLVGSHAAWALGSSVVAQAGIAPLAASLFGGVAVMGPVLLIVSGPVVEAGIALGIVGSLLTGVSGRAADVLLWAGAQAASAAAALWHVAAQIPGAVLPVSAVPVWSAPLWLGAAAALWVRWPRPQRAARVRIGATALVAVLMLSGFAHGVSGPVVDVMDIGQGDAILIRDGSHAVLVDTGPEPAVLRQALARAGTTSFEGVVLTHAHADHIGGLDGLAGMSRPQWIGVPDVVDTAVESLAADCAPRAGQVLRLHRDMTFSVGRITARVLWPRGGERRLSANDTSVVILLTCEGRTALLLGDAEEQAQRGALDVMASPVDMLKVAHHGSPNGNVPTALERWRPPLALISVGEGNRFGHPSRVALGTLAGIGARVRRTDLESDLVWDWSSKAADSTSVSGAAPLCDNRSWKWPSSGRTDPVGQAVSWLLPISPISSPSISSTAPSRCCSSARRGDCATDWPPWPTWISTSMCSTGPRPPPTTCSTPPTPCPS